MKKYILIISAALALINLNSCSENELELLPPSADYNETITTEDKLQQMLNGAYYSIGSSSAFGSDLLVFGDILGDKIYNTPSRALLYKLMSIIITQIKISLDFMAPFIKQ